jgi:hypothetical protein
MGEVICPIEIERVGYLQSVTLLCESSSFGDFPAHVLQDTTCRHTQNQHSHCCQQADGRPDGACAPFIAAILCTTVETEVLRLAAVTAVHPKTAVRTGVLEPTGS